MNFYKVMQILLGVLLVGILAAGVLMNVNRTDSASAPVTQSAPAPAGAPATNFNF